VIVHNLVSGEDRFLLDGFQPRIVSNYLLVVRETSLWAAPFDPGSAQLMGPAVPIVDDFYSSSYRGRSYDVAMDGTLAFVRGAPEGHLSIVDPHGGRTELSPIRKSHTIRLSPDGRRVLGDGDGELWVYALGSGTRLTVATGWVPAWSPDGSSVAYGAGNRVDSDILVKAADGTGDERVLLDNDIWQAPSSWSPDGAWIAIDQQDRGQPDSSFDIWMLSPSGESRPFLATSANESGAMFSPDGRWVAYQSDQSGRFEVYVEPFPGPGERVAVSVQGGTSPVWSPDGSELYFRQDTAVMAASVEVTDRFSVTAPRLVLDGPYWLDATGHVAFGVFPDGKLLMIETGQANEIQVVLNWVEELKRLVPTAN